MLDPLLSGHVRTAAQCIHRNARLTSSSVSVSYMSPVHSLQLKLSFGVGILVSSCSLDLF